MTAQQHATAAAAALDGFPPASVVLFEDRSGDWAVVLVETGSAGHPYPYEVCCVRGTGADGEDAWSEVSGSNGPGWRVLPELGVVTFWGTVDGGESPTQIEFGGRTVEARTNGDYFFFVQWDVAEPAGPRGAGWPRIAGEPSG